MAKSPTDDSTCDRLVCRNGEFEIAHYKHRYSGAGEHDKRLERGFETKVGELSSHLSRLNVLNGGNHLVVCSDA